MKGLDFLKDRFLAFAATECKGNSPLYHKLSIQIANDPALLNLAANTSSWSSGIYFLVVQLGSEKYQMKFVRY